MIFLLRTEVYLLLGNWLFWFVPPPNTYTIVVPK